MNAQRLFFAACALVCGGCSTQPLQQSKAQALSAISVVVTSPSTNPNVSGARARVDNPLTPQQSVTYVYPLISLRSCDQTNKDCALGVAKLESTLMVEKVSTSSVTVRVGLNYRVGRSQTVTQGQSQEAVITLPTHVAVLTADQQLSTTAELAYGEVRHVRLPYGVDFALCITAPAANSLSGSPGTCQDLDKAPSPSSDRTL